MRLLFLLCIFLILWPPKPAEAKVYQYTDKNGVVHFTDKLSNVPENQLPKGTNDEQPGETDTQGKEDEPEATDGDITERGSEGSPDSSAEKAEDAAQPGGGDEKKPPFADEINREKAALDAEHARLTERKKALTAERDTLKTPEEVKNYQKKVKGLNGQIEVYEEKNRAFQKKVDAFNNALKDGEGK